MARHPKGQHRAYCSFTKANLKGTCPYYKPGHYGYECRGFEQAITVFGSQTIYHCKYEPPKPDQTRLPLQYPRG